MNLKEITREEFDLNRKNKLSINFSDSPTLYYNVCLTKFCFSIAYSSDLLKPKTLFIKNKLFIGIDLKIAIIDLISEKLDREIKLSSYFYDFKETENYIIIICELEIIIIDRIGFKEFKRKSFEDLIDDYNISNNQADVYLMNGKQETVNF